MPKLFSIQETCDQCNEMVDTHTDIYEYNHRYYVLPSGAELRKCTFEVPVWCMECVDFTLAYKPRNLDFVRDDLRKKRAKLDNFTRPLQFKIFTRFTRLGKLELYSQTLGINHLEAVLEFASCRVDYHTARCKKCSSTNIDASWWNDQNRDADSKLKSGRKHSCGTETSYVVAEGHFNWGRNWPKSEHFDCADNPIVG